MAFDGRNERVDDSRPGVFALSVTPPSKGEMLSGDPVRVTASDLWVRTEELRRFQKEGSSHVRGDFPASEEAAFSGRSDKLAYLNQAAARFWANADPNDRATHPDNNTVAEWLEGKGYSQTMAAKGATIIRPEWASVGRKPEE